MLDNINKPWVKSVNNKRLYKGINIVYKHTVNFLIFKNNLSCGYKPPFNNLFNHTFTYYLSTGNLPNINLLSKSFTHNPHHLLLNPINEI